MALEEPLTLLFVGGSPLDWTGAARVLSRACPSLTLADATRACRSGQGFLDVMLAPIELRSAAAALELAGYANLVVPVSQRVPPPPSMTVQRARLERAAFVSMSDSIMLPWSDVELVHVAQVRRSTLALNRRPPLVTPSPMRSGADEPPEPWLELFAFKPLLRLRIRGGAFQYDCLGPERTSLMRDNFLRLLGAVASRTRAEAFSLPARAFLDHGPPSSFGMLEAEHERSVSFLLTVTRHRHVQRDVRPPR